MSEVKLFPTLLIPVLAAGCAREDQQGMVPHRAAAEALVSRLDEAFNQRDPDTYLDNFEAENRHLYQVMSDRLRLILRGK